MISQIKTILKSAGQGESLRDRVEGLIYYLRKPFGAKKFLTKVYGRNRFGRFYASKVYHYFSGFLDLGEDIIANEIDLEEGTFIDVGSYVGRYALIASRRLKNRGMVVGFEPSPENFKILKKNIELNTANNVEVYNKAVSDKKGKKKFYILEEGSQGHSLIKLSRHKGRSIYVDCISLDDLKLEDVRLIKIDVERGEFNVLEGARNLISKCYPKIIFECSDSSAFREIKLFLDNYGYHIRKIDEINWLAE